MTTEYPQPPNPWAPDVWLEMTQSTIWLVGPWGRCILEAGDDAWPDGKLGGASCAAQAQEALAQILPDAQPGVPVLHLRPAGDPTPFSSARVAESARSSLPDGAPLWNGTTGRPGGFGGFDGPRGTETAPPGGPEDLPAIPPVPLPMTLTLMLCALILFCRPGSRWRRRASSPPA